MIERSIGSKGSFGREVPSMMFHRLCAYGALGSLLMLLGLALHPRWLEKLLGGTQACLRWHHRFGGLFVLLSASHILLVLKPYVPDWDAFIELVPVFFALDDPLMFSGTMATMLFFVLYPLSFAVKLPFKTWQTQHFLMYAAIFLALFHMFWAVSGRIDQTRPFFNLSIADVFVLPAMGLVGIILIFRIIYEGWPQFQKNFFSFNVRARENPTPNLTLLTLESSGPIIPWQAGDYGDFQFICRGTCKVSRKKHPFTVLQVIPPNTMRLMVGAQGTDTQKLQEILPGTEGRAFGPHSSFGYIELKHPLLWIAGGAGILPFLGLCYHWLEKQSLPIKPQGFITVLYLTEPTKDPFFLKDLMQVKEQIPWIEFSHHALRPTCPDDLRVLLSGIPYWKERHICITGPHGMNYFWTKNLRKMGVPRRKIYTEDTLCANL